LKYRAGWQYSQGYRLIVLYMGVFLQGMKQVAEQAVPLVPAEQVGYKDMAADTDKVGCMDIAHTDKADQMGIVCMEDSNNMVVDTACPVPASF
jgi:hypothetical protein